MIGMGWNFFLTSGNDYLRKANLLRFPNLTKTRLPVKLGSDFQIVTALNQIK